MTYPAALVLIAQADLPVEQPPPVAAAPGLSREPNHCSVPLTPPTSPQQPCSGEHRTSNSTPRVAVPRVYKPSCCISTFLLADSGFVTSVSSVPTLDSSMGVASISPKHSGKKLTCQVVHQAWRECYLNQPQYTYDKSSLHSEFCSGCRLLPPSQLCFVSSSSNNLSDGTSKKEVPNGVATWDFNDLGVRASCSCSRYH